MCRNIRCDGFFCVYGVYRVWTKQGLNCFAPRSSFQSMLLLPAAASAARRWTWGSVRAGRAAEASYVSGDPIRHRIKTIRTPHDHWSGTPNQAAASGLDLDHPYPFREERVAFFSSLNNARFMCKCKWTEHSQEQLQFQQTRLRKNRR